MRNIIDYFIKNSIAANLLMIAIVILGIAGYLSLKSTFFPEIESRLISVRIIYPGASPEEIEEGVVNKIEESLKGVTGVERITSVSNENAGNILIEVFKGYDTDLVLQDVKNAAESIPSFPVGMEPLVVYKQEFIGRAISVGMGGNVDLKTLKQFGRKVEEDLLRMDGISKVELKGFPDEEIEIAFREKDLRAYQLSFAQAASAVAAANIELTGGTLKGDTEEVLLRARNKKYSGLELRNIPIKSALNGGPVVYLHQIADISDQWADNPDRSYVNGSPGVVVTISNTLEEDMLSITDLVKDYVKEFNEDNEVVKAVVLGDASEILRSRMSLLAENGIIGFIIVVLLLAMFLHWRLALWVAIAIPISFAGMFILANMVGITLNVISLFGMILVIGILVDDGIVIGENIYQYHEKGASRFNAALNGTMSVLPAVFAAIVTTVIAFSTFLFLDGSLGDFFREMSYVVIFSLVFSLVEGAFILPTHVAHSKALDRNSKKTKVQLAFESAMDYLRYKLYGPVLKFCLHNKFFTIAVLVSILLMTFGAVGGGVIKTTFFPVIERDNLNITLQMPAGTPKEITLDYLKRIQTAAYEANESLSDHYFNGEKDPIESVELTLGPSTYQGGLEVSLLDGEQRDSLSMRAIINTIREKAGSIPEAEVLSYGAASAFGKPVSLSIIGDDFAALDAAVNQIKDEMSSLEELEDVVDNNQEGLREINITLNEKAEYLGLRLQDVLAQVRQGFFGAEVQRLQRGRDEVRVWVRYAEADRKDVSQLRKMRIRFADGREYQLDEIAKLERQRGVIGINHIDGKREVRIEADVSNDDVSVSDVTAIVKNEIVPSILSNYPGIEALYEGQNKEQEKTTKSMQTVLPIILGLMFFVIAITFGSISQTVVVFLLIPFGFIGVAWGHWLMGKPISLFSFLGVIALIGILVNDALVFVATYNQLLKKGMPQMDAIYESGVSRFRPIVLTSVTTFAGLAPLLFEKSLQAQFLIPMAIAVSFGLLAITVIILLLLPVLLVVSNRTKVYAGYLWNGEKPSYEQVERATRNEAELLESH